MKNDDFEDKKTILTFFVISILLIIIVGLINIFTIKTAWALEVVNPNTSIIRNGTTYYGYNLPTRATGFDGSSSASINVSYSRFYHNHWYNELSTTELLYLRDLDSFVTSKLVDSDIVVPKVWTSTFNLYTSNENNDNRYHFTLGFRPAGVANNDVDMFDDGFAINYNGIYSYTFDLIMYNENGVNVGYFVPNVCDIINDSMSCLSNTTFTSELLYSDDYLKYYRVNINFNSTSWLFGFNEYVISDNNSVYGVKGKNVIANYNEVSNNTGNRFIVSEPYNIRFWSTLSSFSCTDKCWSQSDTDSNQRIEYPNDYIFNNLIDVVDNFDYFGFGGIIHYTYDFIKDLLQDNQLSCIELNVPVLSKNIKLPSSCTFWGRNDVSEFKTFYEMFFTGIFAFYLAFKIYNDILNIYTPDSKVDNEVTKL